ncbi:MULTISPECIES: hypothetical protein [Streptomyces]
MIILAVELLIALMVIAVLGAVVAAGFWVLLAVLVVVAIQQYRRQAAIRRYQADVAAGRVEPTNLDGCEVCRDRMFLCDACVQRHKGTQSA